MDMFILNSLYRYPKQWFKPLWKKNKKTKQKKKQKKKNKQMK